MRRRGVYLVFGAIVAATFGAIAFFGGSDGANIPGFVLLSLVLPALFGGYLLLKARTMLGFLMEHHGLLCPRCHYSLADLPEEGACPECGLPYTREAVLTCWVRYSHLAPWRVRNWLSFHQDHMFDPPVQHLPTSQPTSPWARTGLSAALRAVESVARSHGYTGLRIVAALPPNPARQINDKPAVRPLPGHLAEFYSWYEPALWDAFVQPGSARRPRSASQPLEAPPTDPRPSASPHPLPITIHPSPTVHLGSLEDAASDLPPCRSFLDSIAGTAQADEWRRATIIAFAQSSDGSPLVFCIDPPGSPGGCILAFVGENAPLVLADSLPAWLSRMAACDGIDHVLFPDRVHTLDRPLRDWVVADFKSANPHSARLAILANS